MNSKDFLINLATPVRRALSNAGITTLQQLTGISEDELLKLHGIGPNAIKEITKTLAENGLFLKK